MRNLRLAVAFLPLLMSAPAAAVSITVADPVGDILPSFIGSGSADLDVTSFSVSLDPSATTFSLGAVLAGDINPALAGF